MTQCVEYITEKELNRQSRSERLAANDGNHRHVCSSFEKREGSQSQMFFS